MIQFDQQCGRHHVFFFVSHWSWNVSNAISRLDARTWLDSTPYKRANNDGLFLAHSESLELILWLGAWPQHWSLRRWRSYNRWRLATWRHDAQRLPSLHGILFDFSRPTATSVFPCHRLNDAISWGFTYQRRQLDPATVIPSPWCEW